MILSRVSKWTFSVVIMPSCFNHASFVRLLTLAINVALIMKSHCIRWTFLFLYNGVESLVPNISREKSKSLWPSNSLTTTTTLCITANENGIVISEPIENRIPDHCKSIKIEEYEGYARCLSLSEERNKVEAELGKDSLWRQALHKLSLRRKTKPGVLILLRAGFSELNENATFTGWLDPSLTQTGINQCRHAGRLLMTEGLDPDVVYTSRLQRSITSAWTVLESLNALFIPIQKTYRLNNRMYGALQGLSKEEVTNEFGSEVVQAWRNSLKARPPALSRKDPSHPIHDRRYADLDVEQIPDTESLLECQERARTLWEYKIRNDIKQGKTVLVVAHRDTLRGLSRVIDDISEKDIGDVAIPRGQPIVYKFNGDLKSIKPEKGSLSQVNTNGVFLEKPQQLEKALARNHQYEQAFKEKEAAKKKRVKTLEQSVLKLRRVEDKLTDAFHGAFDNDDFVKLKLETSNQCVGEDHWSDDECEFEEYDEYDEFQDEAENKNHPVAKILPLVKKEEMERTKLDGPFVVLIRHGRTFHNNMQVSSKMESVSLKFCLRLIIGAAAVHWMGGPSLSRGGD